MTRSPYNRPDGHDYAVQTRSATEFTWCTHYLGWSYESEYVGSLDAAKKLFDALAQDKAFTVRLIRVSRYGEDDRNPVAVEVVRFKQGG